MTPIVQINREQVRRLMQRELETFRARNPKSFVLYQRAQHSLLAGVPMHWMTRGP